MSFYTKVTDLQKLMQAWEHVKRNRPASGADNVTWEMFDMNARENLKQLQVELQEHRYQCLPVKKVTLRKEGKMRYVALYSMRDKVIQQSIANELSKMYDPHFSDSAYAYRPGRSALAALNVIQEAAVKAAYQYVLKLDIRSFFDTISLAKLNRMLGQRIAEEDSLELIKKIAAAESISEYGELVQKPEGIHQGSSMAPVLSNIYLMKFDKEMENSAAVFIRYSDDMVMLAQTREQAVALQEKAALLLEELNLCLHESKTVIARISDGFDFLGYHFDKTGKSVPCKAEMELENRLETMWLTGKTLSLQEKLRKGAEILGGWEQYFRENREIATIYEFTVVVYMTARKQVDYTKLAESRRRLQNQNYEILKYLFNYWKELQMLDMAVYEAENYYEIDWMDGDVILTAVAGRELVSCYEQLLEEENEDILTSIMQLYSDVGMYNKASGYMERLNTFRKLEENRHRPVVSLNQEKEPGISAQQFSRQQIDAYMNNFVGREDTYVEEMVANGGRKSTPRPEPLTESLVRKHLAGEITLGTYIQRNNSTVKYMVIDVDISKKVLLSMHDEKKELPACLNRAAEFTLRICRELKKMGICGWIEDSGYRGYHIWVLFTEWISVRYVSMLQDIIENRLETVDDALTVEYFPNKTRLKNGKLGQTIKLPYGLHVKTGKRSHFVDEDFNPVGDAGEFISSMGKYTPAAIKRVISMYTSAVHGSEVKEHDVDHNLSGFGELPECVRLVLQKCNLMRYLCQKARNTGYLSHFERLTVLYVFGHMGEEGRAFVHQVMSYTLNYRYQVTDRFISRIPAKPVSCLKLRDQYQKITAEFGCNCNFKRTKNCYPSPVLHAIKEGTDMEQEITVPTSRSLSKEKEKQVCEELNINRQVEGIVNRILEFKKQKRAIDKNIARYERELERIFNEAGIDCLEVGFGMLVRRKTENGYEWIVEI